MILVDTSVWIKHLREGSKRLESLLKNTEVVSHPFIIGELSCGNLNNRKEILGSLSLLPKAACSNDQEVMQLIERRKLMGAGIGWIDAHLLASALISNCLIWTIDKRLSKIASKLDICF